MLEGTLIAESLRPGTTLDQFTLIVRKIARYFPGGITEDQPGIWTSIDFEIADSEGEALASALAAGLGERAWYANFQSAAEAYVVLAGQVFRSCMATLRAGPGPRRTGACLASLNPSWTGSSDSVNRSSWPPGRCRGADEGGRITLLKWLSPTAMS